ncbi:PP2C family protein-serine/threonine phosphatase [Streptomyces sp. NBC_00306]|uniref:PP2C family protein-serine/threonine phosphatase n=1 Tax=Streptomyces sp. NBC_00306 TaxID=2975708 RepID=UPI002E2A3758|nr:SpoIIE family protein phosphatase [Streptomyces sp. NBC_00306]
MIRDTFRTVHALRRTARRIAVTHRLSAEQRARLVMSLSQVAAPPLNSGRLVTLTAAQESGRGGDQVVVTLRFTHPEAPSVTDPETLPLPGRATSDGTLVWRLAAPPTGQQPAGGEQPGHQPGRIVLPSPGERSHNGRTHSATAVAGAEADLALVEEELQATLARADALAVEHRRLEEELAETNSGVLALYVQLEERDEQLRAAHGHTLRALEDALRPRPLRADGVELAVHYAPASDDAPTGGDLYDWFTLPDGTVHITIVDALGHGVTSTRTALTVTHAVRTLALEGHSLGSIVSRTDEILASFDQNVMATLLLARLDPASGELALANGSHPPALLVRADGTASYLEVRGRGIGYPQPGSERVLTTELEPDDLVILYTDGLTECRRDPYEGEAALMTSALRHRALPTGRIPGAIAADILVDVLHSDDTLAIAARFTSTGDGSDDGEPG